MREGKIKRFSSHSSLYLWRTYTSSDGNLHGVGRRDSRYGWSHYIQETVNNVVGFVCNAWVEALQMADPGWGIHKNRENSENLHPKLAEWSLNGD